MTSPTITLDTAMSSMTSNIQQSTHSRLQALWEERMQYPSRAIRHDKTSVLLLSWEPGHDDLGVETEVRDLKKVFGELYGFRVYDKQLNVKKKPQHQALAHLSAFVQEEDSERGLLIIYYAGHGYSDAESKAGDMNLIGRNPPPSTPEAKEAGEKQVEKNKIVWSKVEPAIQNTDADILLIFDCCNAGRLGRPHTRAMSGSYYEFLGACSHNETTRGPGKESFTSALIAALTQLAKKEEAFSTSELHHTAMKHEDFPDDQTPVLFDRRIGEHIVISHKGLKSDSAKLAPSNSERAQELSRREFLDVRFYFDQKIDQDQVGNTADALKHLMDANKVDWNRASFQGKSSMVEKAVHVTQIWRDTVARNRSNSAVSPNGRPMQFLEAPVTSPLAERRPNPPMTSMPYTPAQSDHPSRASSCYRDDEQMPLLSTRAESRRRYAADESIMFHFQAIVRRVRALLSNAFAWVACKVRVNMFLFGFSGADLFKILPRTRGGEVDPEAR